MRDEQTIQRELLDEMFSAMTAALLLAPHTRQLQELRDGGIFGSHDAEVRS